MHSLFLRQEACILAKFRSDVVFDKTEHGTKTTASRTHFGRNRVRQLRLAEKNTTVCPERITSISISHSNRRISMQKRPRVGLALSAGGARGWAHIGVIETLLAAGVPIDCVAGTSMGALVGAALAADRLAPLHEVAVELDWKRVLSHFVELSFPRAGLIDGRRILQFLKRHVGEPLIESLARPYAAVATDVGTGREVVLRSGKLLEAVRASIAIPGLFTPAVTASGVLVDGGLVNPLPVSTARALGADFVIAVDVIRAPLPVSMLRREWNFPRRSRLPQPRSELGKRLHKALESAFAGWNRVRTHARGTDRSDLPNLFEIFGNAARIVQRQITDMRLEREPPDLLIQPAVQEIRTMDFHRAAEAIAAGAAAAASALSSASRDSL